MEEYVIFFFILLFGISFNNGHTLSRIELNETDIYEVKEGQSTLTITHPKDGKPTLREIVYFHVIEKPYDNDDQIDETPDINKRSFTNSHGFPYFEEHDDDDTDTGDNESVTEQDEYYDSDENETGDTTTESTDTTDDDDSDNDDDEERDNDENDKENGTIHNTDDVELKNGGNDKEVGTINDDEEPIDIDDIKKSENIDARFGDVDNSPINNEPSGIEALPESRQKREIDYKNLPAAPELPEFKLDILPDYIKAIIFADQDADENTNGSDNIEDEIEKQVRLLKMAVNHPPSIERENNNEKRDARTLGNSLEDRRGENTEDTYGMSLTGNVGKVWNNVNGHHLHYINDPETPTSTISKLEAKDTTTTEAFVEDHTEISYQDDHDINKLKDIDELKNFEDSLDEINNLLEELVKNSTSEEKTIVTTDTSDVNKEDSLDIDHPLTAEDNYSKEIESVYENGPADDKKDQKREARTYGMSLAGNRGVVWNDVNTHLSYHVGEPNTISTTLIPEVTDSTASSTTASIETYTDGDSKEPKEVTDEDQLKDIGDSLDEINKLLEELLNMTAKTPSTDKSTNLSLDGDGNGDSKNIENDKDSDHLKDIEDSFDEVNNLFEELIKNNTSETTTESNKVTSHKPNVNDTIATTEATITESDSTAATETTTTKVTTNSTDLDETTDKTTTEIPNNNIDGKNNDRKHNNETHDNEESKQKQFVKELMKNKFFWQWLQDSSTAYLEVLMKKVDDLIKAEVDKQLKQYFEEHKNETKCKPDNNESKKNSTEKPIQNNNATDIDTVTERPISNNTLEKPVETNTTDVTETSTQSPVVTTEPSAVNNTIDMTDNKNKTEDDLARKQNKNSNDKKEPVKIVAQNVYGNSVGNGKVTNIFIFNISKESDLAKMKPLNNGTNGVFNFGIDEKTGKEKDEKTNEGDKPDTSIDVTAKPEINQVTTAKPEVVTNPATEEPKDKIDASTTENAVTDKQTTTESSKTTTTSTHDNNESGNTEKNIETTTEKIIESTTDQIIDSTIESTTDKTIESTTDKVIESTTDKVIETTTEAAKESSTEKSKDIEINTKPEQDKANDKPTEGSTSPNDTNEEEKAKEPNEELDVAKSTTESTKSNGDDLEVTTNVTKMEEKTEEAEPKEKEESTETTKKQ